MKHLSKEQQEILQFSQIRRHHLKEYQQHQKQTKAEKPTRNTRKLNINMKLVTALCLFGLLALTTSAPVTNKIDPKAYLIKYGYLREENKDDPTSFTQALTALQRSGDIPQTGILDDATNELMNTQRCDVGNPSLGNFRTVGRWPRKSLTYSIESRTKDMSEKDQNEEIRRAFKVWSDVTQLTFREVSSGGDIRLRFARRSHGDGDPFDGAGGTLAHAYFPFAGGDCHIDDDEFFTANSSRGINLFQVVAHELGHSLGLDHSNDRNALMAAFYRGYVRNFKLSDDDRKGMQRLYGAAAQQPNDPFTPQPATSRRPFFPRPRPTQRPAATPQPPSSDEPYCRDAKMDVMLTFRKNDRTFGFKGSEYFAFSDTGIEESNPPYPRRIRDFWPGVPDNLDAALTVAPGPSGQEEVWFFKGNRVYYHLTNGRPVRSSQPISQAIRNLPSDIDAIFTWSGNDRVYVMKGSQYYKLSSDLTSVESGYPRSLSIWTRSSSRSIQSALNTGIDAALQYKNGRTYFFKDQSYYRLTDRPLVIDRDYPRRNSVWWFGCPDQN